MLTYVTEQLGLSRGLGLMAVIAGSLLQLVLIPTLGAFSDRVGRRPIMITGAVGAGVLGRSPSSRCSTRARRR